MPAASNASQRLCGIVFVHMTEFKVLQDAVLCRPAQMRELRRDVTDRDESELEWIAAELRGALSLHKQVTEDWLPQPL
jgi:hypothetical protein